MEPGVYSGITNDAYHSGEGISKSGLDLIGRSPLHYWAKYLDPQREPQEPTPAMLLGTAIHSAVLEPHSFANDYVVFPKIDRRTKEGKAYYDELVAQASGRTIISADDYATCVSIQDNVRRHPAAQVLLNDGEPELSVYWRDEQTGVLCKCRPDWMNYKANTIIDVKSTDDASPAGFQKSIVKWGYHVQAAWYLDGVKAATGHAPKAFIFAAFEKTRPFATAFYYADEDMIELGRQLYRERLDVFAACLKNNSWPGYPQQLSPISLPGWVMKAANDNEQIEVSYV